MRAVLVVSCLLSGFIAPGVYAQSAPPPSLPAPPAASTPPLRPGPTGAALSAPGAAPGTGAADPIAGQSKTGMCAGCHGIEGYRTAFPEVYTVPRIAGQHEAYLVRALQAYRSGERTHPSMRAVAASLTDKDMADLAAYYARADVKTAVVK